MHFSKKNSDRQLTTDNDILQILRKIRNLASHLIICIENDFIGSSAVRKFTCDIFAQGLLQCLFQNVNKMRARTFTFVWGSSVIDGT